MVNDYEVKFGRKSLNRRVAELIQGALFPADADVRMDFLVALRRGDQRRKGPAVVPRDAGELDWPAHAFSRTAAIFFMPAFWSPVILTSRIFSQRFVCADS